MIRKEKMFNKRGSALLSVLLALVIIGLIYYFATKNSQKSSDPSHKSFLKEAGVDTSSYKGTLDSTKKIIKDAEASRSEIP